MVEADLPTRRPQSLWATYFKSGLFAVLARRADRFKIFRMDEVGFSTLGGQNYTWSDITHVDRTAYTLLGSEIGETVYVRVASGKRLKLPLTEARNGPELLSYFLQHVQAR